MEFWQTKSFAIITYGTTPGDCVDRVTSQNGARVIFKRLETPRPVPEGNVEKELAKPAGEAAFLFLHTNVPSFVKTMVV